MNEPLDNSPQADVEKLRIFYTEFQCPGVVSLVEHTCIVSSIIVL